MAVIKCKNCGGDMEISADKTFGTCEYCGSTMTLPKVSDDQSAAAFIRGAISYAEAIGKAYRDTLAAGGDYVKAVTEAGKGKMMFEGTVTGSGYETRDGYTFGDTVIQGTGAYEGHQLHIWYQNENIISWLDGEYFVTVPDLICVFDLDQGLPQLNPFARVGEKVAVTALPAAAEWTTARGLEVFGPRSFGHNVDYRPYC